MAASGYGCEFVEPPPKLLQSECPVCLMILREPHLTSCCGHSFCKACIEAVQNAGQPCPLCKEATYTTMRNKGLERNLKELTVVCEHKDAGCNWRGALGHLDGHVKESCPCVQVECKYADCHTVGRRKDILLHESSCKFRPYSCEWCQQYDSLYDGVVQHWSVCPMYPMVCKQCTRTVVRQNLSHHEEDECPLTLVECEFSSVGCRTRHLRKDSQAHLSSELLTHLAMMNRKLSGDNTTLASRLLELETKLVDQKLTLEAKVLDLEKQVADMKKELCVANKKENAILSYIFNKTDKQPQIVPIKLEVNFSRRTQPSTVLKTAVFYSHFGGYRMELQLYAKEIATDLVLSLNTKRFYNLPDIYLRIRLVEGDFDDCLQWPFNGTVVVCLEPDKRQYISFKDAPLEYKSSPRDCKWYEPSGMLFLGQICFSPIQTFVVEQVQFNH